jgi:hypothetical protein
MTQGLKMMTTMTVAIDGPIRPPVHMREPAAWLTDAGLVSAHTLSNGREVHVRWCPVNCQENATRVLVVVNEVNTATPAPTQMRDNVWRLHAAKESERLLEAFEALPPHAAV